MIKTLQELFIESEGRPVRVGEWLVRQLDVIPIKTGKLTIRFLKGDDESHGIRLKATDGWIEMSDGAHAKVVDTWRAPGLSDEISYRVHCPSGAIKVWNIYKNKHPDGTTTVDMWTGNSGLVVLADEVRKLTYGCSRNTGDFDPRCLVVQIEWSEKTEDRV
jgi:hypothetical protein